MKFRGLLAATVVLGILGGLVWWSERRQKAEADKPAKDAPPKLISIPDDQVRQVEIRKRDDSGTLVLKRDARDRWEIVAPQALPADQDAVRSLVTTADSLTADRVVEDKAGDLAGYGLNPPALEVTLTKKDGKSEKLLVGDDTPTSNGAYAKLAAEARVVTIASYSKTSLDKGAGDLRDKRVLSFDTNKLTGVEVTAKGDSLSFAKNNNNDWAIVKPAPQRADNFQVEELVRKLNEMKMSGLGDDPKVAKEFASAKPVLTAKVTDSGGTQTLEIRQKGEKSYYARSSARKAEMEVEASAVEGINKPLADYRNKKVFDLTFNEPNRLEVRDGAKSYVFVKGGEKWFLNGKEMDSLGVQTAISRVREMSATGFAGSGFTTAAVEIAVAWNDGKRTDRVQFTKTESGYLAKREGEPALYTLDANAVDDAVKAAAEIKPAQPAKDAKKK